MAIPIIDVFFGDELKFNDHYFHDQINQHNLECAAGLCRPGLTKLIVEIGFVVYIEIDWVNPHQPIFLGNIEVQALVKTSINLAPPAKNRAERESIRIANPRLQKNVARQCPRTGAPQ